MPAVSVKMTLNPEMVCLASMVSRVVPALGETIARFRSISRFRREDFPEFGAPAIIIRMPCFRQRPFSKLSPGL
jgi:hypothetical protein